MSEKIKLKLPACPHKKGLSVYFGMDLEYGGFDLVLKKNLFELKLAFIVFRIAPWSETKYNSVMTMATLRECQTVSYTREKE